MVYSDTTGGQGLVQLARSYVKSDSDQFTDQMVMLYLNLAMRDYASLALKTSRQWQFDDSEYDDFPIATTDVILDQADYEFNETFLNIRKAEYTDSNGTSWVLIPRDERDYRNISLTERAKTSGKPAYYYLKGASIILDPKPDENVTSGLKVYYERSVLEFTGAAGQKPGIPITHQAWLSTNAALTFAIRENLKNKNDLKEMVQNGILEIEDDLSRRNKTIRPRLTGAISRSW